MFVVVGYVLLGFLGLVLANLNNDSSPAASFHTRPEIHAPLIRLEFVDTQQVSPEYLFLAPYRNKDPGPYIYDNVGGNQHQGFARGHGVIMNRHYEVVKTIQSPFFLADMHEFRLCDGGKRALMTSYQTRQFDMTRFGLQAALGWIVDSVFYEVDVETGIPTFQWRALDHISPYDSYVGPRASDTSGDGLTAESPWDFFHINSIDKNNEGDYLISARHMSSVYKISGKDGSVIWSLNGEISNYALEGFTFSHQHDARWLAENSTHTVISIFDNSGCVRNITYPESRGMVISLDHEKGTANLLAAYAAPKQDGLMALSQGNMQVLPNGNVFVTWGDHPFFSEYLPSGEALSWGKLAFWGSNVMMYRGHKFNWVGEPRTQPILWTYSATGRKEQAAENGESIGGMAFHVSWNGATEVRAWRFYISSNVEGPWRSIATVPKAGFETTFHIPEGVWKYAFAEALDGDNRPLRRSQIMETMVPSPFSALNWCDNVACFEIRDQNQFNYDVPLLDVFTVQHDYKEEKKQNGEEDGDNPGQAGDSLESSYGGDDAESHWLLRMIPSRKLAKAITTQRSEDLPPQMDETKSTCSQVSACRHQADPPGLVDILSNAELGATEYLRSLLILTAILVLIFWFLRRRRSFRGRFTEKRSQV